MSEVCDLTGSELAEKLRAGELSAAELTESSLRRVDAVDGDVKAILTPTPEVARERAATEESRPGCHDQVLRSEFGARLTIKTDQC